MPYDFSEEANLTNKKLAGELSKLTPLKAEEIEKILPTKAEKMKLNKILEIVDSSAAENKKLSDLKDNFEEVGGVVLKLLKKYLL